MKCIMSLAYATAMAAAFSGCALVWDGSLHGKVLPTELTAEYRADPVGIDTPAPRLSWKLIARDGEAKGLLQTAYQVRVASSQKKLAAGEADLWDSGKVAGDQSLNVIYKGKALASSQRCWWSVRVWNNKDGSASAWSKPGRWIMGIVRPQDWKAQWIGANTSTRRDYDLRGAEWIWTGECGLGQAAAGNRFFRKVFNAPDGNADIPAVLAVTADDEWEIRINGKAAAQTWGHFNDWRWMKFIDVAPFLKPGANVIAVRVANAAVGPTGLLLCLTRGDALLAKSDTSWATSLKGDGIWDARMEEFPGWGKAVSAGVADCQPWGHVNRMQELVSPAFRKTFTVAGKGLRSATLHITGVGFYEARLNGTRIGKKVLDPAPTKYDKRVLYSTYDLTDSVKAGQNTMDVLLGHGWYDTRSVAVWNFDNAPWRNFPRMIAQLELAYTDGTTDTVVSDNTWRQVSSPVGFDCIREGEVIGKARADAPDLDKTAVMAEVVPAPGSKLVSEAQPGAEITQEFAPAKIREVKPGMWIVDFGQNMAGWVRMNIKGQKAGDIIRFNYGEKLNNDGSLSLSGTDAHFRYPASFFVLPGGWFQTDRFVCKGSASETYEPRFTYNGFQYVQITGLATAPTVDSIKACVVHTAFTKAGSFTCSNELLNKIQNIILWSYRSNFADGYPTDCPHREKNGWTGDANLASELAMYNFQNVAGYEKWINDLMDEQRPDGNLPGIVPTSGWGYVWGNGPAWDSALVIIPWMLYTYQGDVSILQKAYPAMAKYVDYLGTRSKDGTVSHGLGDWCPFKAETPVVVTSTGYYYVDAQIVARTAELLGDTAGAQKYNAVAARVRDAFNRTQYKGDGVYANATQTAESCALHQGFVPQSELSKTQAKLVASVEATKGSLDFGIFGSKYVFRALSDAGRTDLAYAMATKEDAPSFGNWIKRGATTAWEDWGDGASRNHIMFGDLSAWMYQYLGGIRLATSVSTIANAPIDAKAVGFKRFVIAPQPVKGLSWVKAEHDSPYGFIRSEWLIKNGAFELDAEVPVNTEATVILPAFNGKPSASQLVGSGKWHFTVK